MGDPMGELKIQVSDRIILVFLGLFVFGLLFNLGYSMQHELKGYFAVPMWIIFIMICLVAKPMRNQKMIAYFGLLVVGVALEYYRATSGAAARKEFDPIKFGMLVVGLYSMILWYFLSLLFARLDRLAHDGETLSTEVKGLSEESVRVAKAVDKAALAPDASQQQVEYLGPAANYGLLRRAFSDLAMIRTPKEVPSFLARTLRDGFGVDRGMIVELPSPSAKQMSVREVWGEAMPKPGPPVAAIRFPQSLIDMVTQKMGAVLSDELEAEGPHLPDVALLTEANLEPVSVFPVVVRDPTGEGEERVSHLLVALKESHTAPGAAAQWSESMDGVAAGNQMPKPRVELRVLPVQIVLTAMGQYLARMKGR